MYRRGTLTPRSEAVTPGGAEPEPELQSGQTQTTASEQPDTSPDDGAPADIIETLDQTDITSWNLVDDLLTKIVDVPTQQHLGPWLSGKKMLNEPGPALKDMRPKEKTGKPNCACTSCSEVQQMWWQQTWMV